jgi:hypothetical protein
LLTDAVICIRQIPIFGQTRRVLFVAKLRGSEYDQGIRELAVTDGEVRVDPSFEGLKGVLTGRPEPLDFFLKLFYENPAERHFNQNLVRDFRRRFPDLKLAPTHRAKQELQTMLMEAAEEAIEFGAPHANIKVSPLDEYWVPALIEQRRLVPLSDHVHPAVLRRTKERWLPQLWRKRWMRGPRGAIFAVPIYADVALYLCNNQLLGDRKVPET